MANLKNPYFFFYLILVLSFSLFLSSFFLSIAYLAFSFFLGIIWVKESKESNFKKKNLLILFFLFLVIILGVRLFPLVTDSFLGYDTGLYKKYIEDYIRALPGLPNFNSDSWAAREPVGLYLLTNTLYLIGFSSEQILFAFFVIIDIFLGIGIYTTVKNFFDEKAAICSLFLFTISITQFQTYWYLFYKQILGLFLLLAALILLKKKSYLVIPVAAFLAGVHQMTFFIFACLLFLHFIFNKEKRYHFISGFFVLTIGLLFYLHRPETILGLFSFLNPLSAVTSPEGLYGGRFFGFSVYHHLALFYFPLAFLGFIYLIKEKKFNYLFFWFVINLSIVCIGFFFHNRFIVSLDIIFIILAGVAASKILEKRTDSTSVKLMIIVFLIGAFYSLYNNVVSTEPLITKDELEEIKSMNQTEENAFVMSSISHYSPWIYGYGNRKTIAPGLFEYDKKWTKEEWEIFWQTDDSEVLQKLLGKYESPLYIFVGDRQGDLKEKFDRSLFMLKYSNRIYKYKN